MKVQDVIKSSIGSLSEGLKAHWDENTVGALSVQKIKNLQKNAEQANDQKVLDVIKSVLQKRYENSKKRAAELKRIEREERAQAKKDANPTKITKKEAEEVGRKIEDVVGSTFPDGDPIDTLGPWIQRKFDVQSWHTGEILDQGARTIGIKKNQYKDYSDYLAQSWDDYAADFPELEGRRNPWR